MKHIKPVLVVYKPLGVTPLFLVRKCKEKFPEYENETISYAGRLDPMASGVVLLLVGDENKKREKYLHLDKEYSVKILFGIETDTYDVLGNVISSSEKRIETESLIQCLDQFKGSIVQKFPPYSSKRIKGKPLFYWARENKLDDIDIPSKKRNIYEIVLRKHDHISKKTLEKMIYEKLDLVEGNFRQEAIRKAWNTFFSRSHKREYYIGHVHVKCSSGTYMRTLAHDVGKKLGTHAIALHIERTSVGGFTREDCISSL